MSLIEHKKARLNYEILEEFEAGLELLGPEVKSLRAKLGKLEGSHVVVRGGSPHSAGPRRGRWEAYIIGMHIPPYQAANSPKGYDADRSRKLLLTKPQIAQLAQFEGQKGLTIVPLRVYNKGRVLKVAIGVARGKKAHDKRAALKERDSKRDIDRSLKNQ